MDPGTAFAILQFSDQCIKYGQKLVRRCQNYRHAEAESRELMISIEHNWMKTEAQINFLKKISKALDPTYCDVQSRVLSELEGKLKTATLTMDQLILHEREEKGQMRDAKYMDLQVMAKALEKMTPKKKVKYAFKKESLEAIRDDLESWQRRFDPSWMLTMLITDSLVDEQLEKEEKKPQKTKFILAAKGVRDAAKEPTSASDTTDGGIFKSSTVLTTNEKPIPLSSTIICRLADSEDSVLVDTMICNAIADRNRTLRDVRKLAQILSKVDPSTFGLLNCTGVVKSTIAASGERLSTEAHSRKPLTIFRFLFAIPYPARKPKSLRALLVGNDPSYSLNDRYNLAKQLASSVLYIHSSQFVHKNIRPETTIIFEKESNETTGQSSNLFLVGFENFRPAEGMTYRTSDGIWQHDLYRHPTRQGTQPEEEYQMKHDIYSLGVVLLEIGLWESFLSYRPLLSSSSPDDFEAKSEPKLDEHNPIPSDFIAQQRLEKDIRKRATAIKTELISLASRKLPPRMGYRYTNIVLLCLRCLDQGTPRGSRTSSSDTAIDAESLSAGAGFEEVDMLDEDGIVVGVKYIEAILLRIQEISV